MASKSFPAYFMRGGTSNGLMINRKDLPLDETEWQPILASAMGSPDPYGRQLDGMGSGISSTSKVMVMSKSQRPDVDVDYTFVQVGIKDGSLDMAANCGNMSAAIGPWAVNTGMVTDIKTDTGGRVKVRLFNTNTSKRLDAEFSVGEDGKYNPFGDYEMNGVPGTASRITMLFKDPAGAKTGKALPSGNAIDELILPDGGSIMASLIDIANPGVFISAADVGVPSDISSEALGADSALMERLEIIRQAGATCMGLDPMIQSVPKIVLISKPRPEEAVCGVTIVCRALSMQQAHKAVPLTHALNLGASCAMDGTLPNLLASNAKDKNSVIIAHASGTLEVGSVIKDGRLESATLHRTARVLMAGDVSYTI